MEIINHLTNKMTYFLFTVQHKAKAVFEEMRRSLRRVLHFLGKRYHWSPLIRRKLTLSLEDQRAGIVNVRF